jgi:hypothetical protein
MKTSEAVCDLMYELRVHVGSELDDMLEDPNISDDIKCELREFRKKVDLEFGDVVSNIGGLQ